MRVIDNSTHQHIGYLSDISPRGLKLDCQKPLTANINYPLRLDLTSEISNRPYITLLARAIWSRPDPINPNEYIVGFQIVSISQAEQEIFQRIVEKYSTPESKW